MDRKRIATAIWSSLPPSSPSYPCTEPAPSGSATSAPFTSFPFLLPFAFAALASFSFVSFSLLAALAAVSICP